METYPTEAFSPVARPPPKELPLGESETPPPDSPQFRREAHLPTLDLSPVQAKMSAELEMRSFLTSPSQRVAHSVNEEENAASSSSVDWNSEMTEPESDDEEANRLFERARERTLAKRTRIAAVRTQGPPQDEIPDTPDQMDDSQGQLEPTDVQTIPSSPPASPPQSFVRAKRKPPSEIDEPSKKMRSASPVPVEDGRILLDKTESQKHEAALAIRNALHTTGTAVVPPATDRMPATVGTKGRMTAATGGRGRGRGRGKSVW